ncbi:CDP-glucose 4,6-dehydratase [Longitalea arenae]|uniref:CDP-glucose 4,6-dehydratase n=1 Tax=Longitalea arenae TaxID=2812558 RepID=UPI001967404A|nr:CDP-glucose 4,6-dehydratase [Longitalea arenae]
MENLEIGQHLSSYYRHKKVFITGHTGFKGSWLTATLHLFGATVKGYALAPDYKNGLYELLQPYKVTHSIIADIRDKARLTEELLDFQPDYVFHLAAQPLVRRSYEIPAETFDVNVTGTANLLEAVNMLPGKCTVIVITTDKVYENREKDILYNEEDVLGGYDPYSASKACAELVVNSFRNSFFNPAQFNKHKKAIASVRAGNVIGGGDWSRDRIIPDIVRALQQEKTIEVRNPSAVRPWQHVLEPIGGYLLLAGLLHEQPQKYSAAYNFGPLPDDHLTVKELVQLAIASWGSGEWKDVSDPAQVHEAGLLKLDIGRARTILGWQPSWKATQAIQHTIDWYKQPVAVQAKYAFQQINSYFGL